MRISKWSQVLEPSPQGDFRVVCERTLVGRRTGPLTRSCLSLERFTRSEQTGVNKEAFQEEREREMFMLVKCSLSLYRYIGE